MSDTETIWLPYSGTTGPAASEGEGVTIPRRLGTVALLRQIGKGGMGVVWLARDELLKRNVAVKFLLGAVSSEHDTQFATFIEGAQAAAAVHHHGLNMIYQAAVVQSTPYIVMEFINGPTLAAMAHTAGPFDVPVVLALMDAISGAVGELHAHGIIHRDIKPANVLLDEDARVVVTDFGLACLRPHVTLDSIARVAGTPVYMAPEMFEGTISPRTDVYALGVMLFELLSGTVPYQGSLDELREAHSSQPLPIQRLRDRGVQEGLVELVERTMQKSPARRLRSGAHVQHALHEACPDASEFRRGKQRLPALASRARGTASGGATETPSSSQGYYETIGARAASKRAESSVEVKPATPAPLPPPAGADQSGPRVARVNANVDCVSCGYNLKGLPESGNCSECGEPISASLGPERLVFANRRWLSHRFLGLKHFTRAFLGACLFGPAWLFLPSWLSIPAAVLAVICLWVMLRAVFLMTGPEPYSAGRVPERARRATRWMAVAVVTIVCASGVLLVGSRQLVGLLVGILGVVLFLIWVPVVAHHVAAMADRIPDRRLSRQLRGVTAALSPAAALLYVLFIFVRPSSVPELGWFIKASPLFGAIAGLFAAIVLVRGMLTLKILLRQTLARAVESSKILGESDLPAR